MLPAMAHSTPDRAAMAQTAHVLLSTILERSSQHADLSQLSPPTIAARRPGHERDGQDSAFVCDDSPCAALIVGNISKAIEVLPACQEANRA